MLSQANAYFTLWDISRYMKKLDVVGHWLCVNPSLLRWTYFIWYVQQKLKNIVHKITCQNFKSYLISAYLCIFKELCDFRDIKYSRLIASKSGQWITRPTRMGESRQKKNKPNRPTVACYVTHNYTTSYDRASYYIISYYITSNCITTYYNFILHNVCPKKSYILNQ